MRLASACACAYLLEVVECLRVLALLLLDRAQLRIVYCRRLSREYSDELDDDLLVRLCDTGSILNMRLQRRERT
jgi:hypothetical protein